MPSRVGRVRRAWWSGAATALLALGPALPGGCAERPAAENARIERRPVATAPAAATAPTDRDADVRRRMVDEHIALRGVTDERVLAAMRRVPRHEFVPAELRKHAYADRPLPIGLEQTISQPYIVAFMSAALDLDGDERVLEIGTGSGYQAAVLAELAGDVYSIEIVPALAERARVDLARTGYDAVHLRTGDGYVGWPEAAPFDAIIVTAAPDHVPRPLIDQLAVGGRLIIPVGRGSQELVLLRKTATGIERRELLPVRFVPMTGDAERDR